MGHPLHRFYAPVCRTCARREGENHGVYIPPVRGRPPPRPSGRVSHRGHGTVAVALRPVVSAAVLLSACRAVRDPADAHGTPRRPRTRPPPVHLVRPPEGARDLLM